LAPKLRDGSGVYNKLEKRNGMKWSDKKKQDEPRFWKTDPVSVGDPSPEHRETPYRKNQGFT
jgi:hypothetical protein